MLRSCLGLHNFRFLFLSHVVQAQSHNLEVNGQILDEITSVACFWSDEQVYMYITKPARSAVEVCQNHC